MRTTWPENVGILAIELIFPSIYVDQKELETYDGVSPGKYTVGLGQSRMSFCSDLEDTNSLSLTVVSKLMERHNIKPTQIGRLEVGTESLLDKSKSVKTVLMDLFSPHGATDIEGIDTTNACYGGTAALFNAINWVESSSWDGRFALVVSADIALYAAGPARPTGGAGAVAILVGPNAPLVFDQGVRATFMKNAYDFYKPIRESAYALLDGKLSVECYLKALDHCYQLYRKKFENKFTDNTKVGLDSLDYVVCHTPYCKLVQKSIARICLNDFILTSEEKRAVRYPGLEKFNNVKLEKTYFDKEVEKAFMAASKNIFESKTKNTLLLASQIGNMYTSSVFSGLVSLLINVDTSNLVGKRIGMFSYGSGLAASMYSIVVSKDISLVKKLVSSLSHIKILLNEREKVSPGEFNEILNNSEKNHKVAPFEPLSNVASLFPGTYYLKRVDELYRRTYERVPVTNGVQS